MSPMPETRWHPDGTALGAYAANRVGAVVASSIEAHLVSCERCREQVAPLAPAPVVDRGRARLQAAMLAPRHPLVIRVARRLGLSEHSAVLLSQSRAMSDPWVVAMVVVLCFATAATAFDGRLGAGIFLLVAPLAPVLGVALAYSGSNPALEQIAGAAPYPSLRLLLLRTTAVLLTCVPVTVLAALVVRHEGWMLVGWLLPSLAFTLVVLALSTWFAVELTTAGVALVWAFTVGAATVRQDAVAVVAEAMQPLYLVVALAAAVVIAVQLRRDFNPGGLA